MSTTSREVVDNVLAISSNRSAVDGLSSTLEQEQSVESLEEQSRRLVDRAKNRLSVVGELAQQSADRESRLTVQTRGRLVEEQQHRRLGSELDTDRDTLSVTNTQTESRVSNNSLGEILQLEQLDNVFDVLVLLLDGDIVALTEVSREAKSFTNTAHGLVNVLLLGITALTLERDIDVLALDQTLSFDDTDGLAVGQNIEQSRLTGTRTAHERSHGSRLDISENLVQQFAVTTLNGDSVLQVRPGERLTVDFEFGFGLLACTGTSVSELLVEFLLLLVGRLLDNHGGSESALIHQLDAERSNGNESKQESDQDTNVAPKMARLVPKAGGQVVDTRNLVRTGCSSGERANLVVGQGCRVTSSTGDDLSPLTGESGALKLVDHQSLESVKDRVDVRDPEQPPPHRSLRDNVSGPEDERCHDDSSETSSRVKVGRDRTEQCEQCTERVVSDQDDEPSVKNAPAERCNPAIK